MYRKINRGLPFVVCTGRAGEFTFCSFMVRAGKFTFFSFMERAENLSFVFCTERARDILTCRL